MGAVRFKGELQSRRGVLYAIEIWDETYSGAVTDIRLSSDGFRLSYDAVNDSRTTPIIASRLTFGWQIRNATDEAFITNLLTAAEGRFTIKVTRNSTIYWVGYIQPDISVLQDMAYPYRFDVTATDGLGRLKNIDYTATGQNTFLTHILNCLTQDVVPARYFAVGDIFLRTSVDWWHTTHSTQTTAKDPLALSRFDGSIFQKTNSDGTIEYRSCFDVLANVLTAWNARVYQSGGCWRVEQADYRLNNNFNERRYGRTGTVISTATANYDRSLPQNATGAKQRGITYDWFPPLKNVFVKYAHKTAKNWLEGLSSLWGTGATNGVKTLNVQSVDSTSFFRIHGNLRLKLATSNTNPWYYTVQMKVKVGSNELSRDVSVVTGLNLLNYANPTWAGSGSKCDISSGFVFSTSFSGSVPFTVWTPTIPSSGTVTVEFLSVGAKDKNGSTVFLTTDEWYMENIVLEIANSTNATNFETDREYQASNAATGNSEIITIETQIGEAVKEWTPGKVQVSPNGSTWSDTTSGWAEGGQASSLQFGQLLANAILGGQDTPVKKMHGSFFGDNFYFHNLISDLALTKWLFLGGTFTSKTDTWDGEWWGVIYTPKTGGTIKTNSTFDPALPTNDTPFFPEKTTVQTDPTQIVFESIAAAKTNAGLSSGAVTSIALSGAVNAGAFQANQKIRVINPQTGQSASLTVTTTTAGGATSLAVSGTLATSFPANSIIIKDDFQNNASGGTASDGNGIYSGSGSLSGNTTVTLGTSVLTWDASGASGSTPTPFVFKVPQTGSVTGRLLSFQDAASTETFRVEGTNTLVRLRSPNRDVLLYAEQSTGKATVQAGSYSLQVDGGGFVKVPAIAGNPASIAAAAIWNDSTSGSEKMKYGKVAGTARTFASVEDDLTGTSGTVSGTTDTPGGNEFTVIYDANSNAITVTLGPDLLENRDYLFRCQRNGTNVITFNADTGNGITLKIDESSTLNPTTFAAGGAGTGLNAPHKIYTVRRAGSVVFIR